MPINFGPMEMVLVFVVILLLFGAKRLPEIGSSLGKGIREFKSSVKDLQSSVRAETEIKAPPGPNEHVTSRSSDSPEDGEPRRLKTSSN